MTRRFRLSAALALSAAVLALVALAGREPVRAQYRVDTAAAVVRMSLADFKKLADAGAIVVLDVRSPDQYEAGHVPGAINVPLETVTARAATWKGSTKPVVTYCA